MSQGIEGKVALVTGAAAGIGFATARRLAEAGAKVVLADLDGDQVVTSANILLAAGHDVLGTTVDVTDDTAISDMMAKTLAVYGRLDIAFNNAGVISRHAETADLDGDEWDRVMAVNLRGAFRCMQAEIMQMLKQGDGGAIVNCSSIGGLRGVAGLPAYIASKHGLLGLTKAAALEVCTKGIRVNAVCPGQIDTPMNDWLTGGDKQKTQEMVEKTQPIGRLGTPEEIADAVLWLVGPGATFVIGAAIPVDGGQSAR